MKATKSAVIDEWTKKMWYITFIYIYIYTYIYIMKYYLTIKKDWNLAFCNNMDGSKGYYTRWNKLDRKTNTKWCHLWNLQNRLNLRNLQSKMNKQNRIPKDTKKIVVARVGERWRGRRWRWKGLRGIKFCSKISKPHNVMTGQGIPSIIIW